MKQWQTRATAACLAAVLAASLAGCSQNAAASGGETTSAGETTAGQQVIFSQAGGLYEEAFELVLTTAAAGGTVRYTLDGSDPTADSPAYTEPLPIADRTGEDNLLSAITTGGGGGMGGGFGGVPGRTGDEAGGRPEGMAAPEPPAGENTPAAPTEGTLPDDSTTGGTTPAVGTTPAELPAGEEWPEGTAPPEMPTEGELPEGGTTPPGGGAGRGGGGFGMGNPAATPAENVFKGTVVKAAVFSETGEMLSAVAVQSYFVSEDIFTRYEGLPVVSIVTDADNFFDEESGIYTNYNESGSDWERPAYLEIFEADGTPVVAQNTGVRINGGTTRSLAQKALRFYAKESYDAENPTIEYELFEGLTTESGDALDTFKRILLRGSGNDNSGTLMRDALMQSLSAGLQVDTQASRPCVAFVNGEFWGIYNIRERYDDHYFATHYGIDAEDVAVLEIASGNSTPEINEGDESDLAYYNEMWTFFSENSLADAAAYETAGQYIDIGNFIDYYIANIYCGNTDWPANNNVFWRYKTANGGYDDEAEWYADGRFRWILKDMDWGFGLMGSASDDTLAHALSESAGGGMRGGGGFTSADSTLLFRKLLENESFKAQFINRFCDVMNTSYETETVVAAIDAMQAAIAPAIGEQANRYPSSVASAEAWEANVAQLAEFARQRPGYMQGLLQSHFGLGQAVAVTLQTEGEGSVLLNGMALNVGGADGWTGTYFAGTIQTVHAEAASSRDFVKYVVTDTATGEVAEYTDSTLTLTLGEGATVVQAVFS